MRPRDTTGLSRIFWDGKIWGIWDLYNIGNIYIYIYTMGNIHIYIYWNIGFIKYGIIIGKYIYIYTGILWNIGIKREYKACSF